MTESSLSHETFYRRFWSRPGWNAETPNTDELARWRAIESLLDRLPHSPRSILDLGCGRGWLTILLNKHGPVLGIDPLSAAVERARELFPLLEFRHASMLDLLEDAFTPQFDLIVSSEVLEHVPDPEKPQFFRQMSQLLSRDGHVVLTTPRGELWKAWSARAPERQPVEDWVTESQLDRLARAAGFRPVARCRARPSQRPLNWQGFLLRRVLERRGIRRLPLSRLHTWLTDRASLYQVVLLRQTSEPPSP